MKVMGVWMSEAWQCVGMDMLWGVCSPLICSGEVLAWLQLVQMRKEEDKDP